MKMHMTGLDPLKAVNGRISRFFPLFNSGSATPVASVPGLDEGAEVTYFDDTRNNKKHKQSI
jgi:hypothetical protein